MFYVDDRFIVKQMSSMEAESFEKFGHDYFLYINKSYADRVIHVYLLLDCKKCLLHVIIQVMYYKNYILCCMYILHWCIIFFCNSQFGAYIIVHYALLYIVYINNDVYLSS